MIVDDFGSDLVDPVGAREAMPVAVAGSSGTVAELRGAAVSAFSLVSGAESCPWLVRVECTDG